MRRTIISTCAASLSLALAACGGKEEAIDKSDINADALTIAQRDKIVNGN